MREGRSFRYPTSAMLVVATRPASALPACLCCHVLRRRDHHVLHETRRGVALAGAATFSAGPSGQVGHDTFFEPRPQLYTSRHPPAPNLSTPAPTHETPPQTPANLSSPPNPPETHTHTHPATSPVTSHNPPPPKPPQPPGNLPQPPQHPPPNPSKPPTTHPLRLGGMELHRRHLLGMPRALLHHGALLRVHQHHLPGSSRVSGEESMPESGEPAISENPPETAARAKLLGTQHLEPFGLPLFSLTAISGVISSPFRWTAIPFQMHSQEAVWYEARSTNVTLHIQRLCVNTPRGHPLAIRLVHVNAKDTRPESSQQKSKQLSALWLTCTKMPIYSNSQHPPSRPGNSC